MTPPLHRFQFEDALLPMKRANAKSMKTTADHSTIEQATRDTGSINPPKSDAYAEEINTSKTGFSPGQFLG